MRVYKLRITLIALAITLTSCSRAPDCFDADIFCAALVTDTFGLNDHGLNQNAWLGLQQSKNEGVVDQLTYIESVNSRDYEKNIAFFVRQGYDMIVTSSVGLQNATLHSADLYPDSVFIGINQTDDESKPNFISVTFPEDQMGFFAGVLATHVTKTNIVGGVCEASGIDAMWRYCEGFRAGVKYENHAVKPLIVYRDSGGNSKLFIDSEWGYNNAQQLIHDGADVIFAAGGRTATGALQAATEAQIKSIGTERDQGAVLAEQGASVVTAIFGRADITIRELTRRIKAGDLTDEEMSPFGYVPFDSALSLNLIARMNDLLTELTNLSTRTGAPRSKP